MKCRYCNRPNVEWRVELHLYVCDTDYDFPSLVLDPKKDAGERQRYEYQLLGERSITK